MMRVRATQTRATA